MTTPHLVDTLRTVLTVACPVMVVLAGLQRGLPPHRAAVLLRAAPRPRD